MKKKISFYEGKREISEEIKTFFNKIGNIIEKKKEFHRKTSIFLKYVKDVKSRHSLK